jgi:hypothetical protein
VARRPLRTRLQPEQKRDAKCCHPESPAGASDEAGEVEHGKAGEGRCQNVSLVEQIDHADEQADDSQPARQYPTTDDDAAERDGPADLQQLSEVLTERAPPNWCWASQAAATAARFTASLS